MTITSEDISPEDLTFAEEFFHYVLGNALNWPYFMGYLLLATLIIVGIFKPAWLEKLGEWALAALLCLVLLALAFLVLYVMFGVMVLVLQRLGLPLVAVWNIAFMLIIGIALAVVFVIARKCKDLTE